MSLSKAIKNRDKKELKRTVKEAIKLYNAEKPEAEYIDTVYGTLPINAIFDKDSLWITITAAYADIVRQVENLPKGADIKIETAKLIAQNAVLRNVFEDNNTSKDNLL